MQDDCYLIAADGWVGSLRVREVVQLRNKDGTLVWPESCDFLIGKRRFKSDLVPGSVLISRFFPTEQAALEALEAQLAGAEREMEDQRDEHGVEGGLLDDVTDVDGDKRRITARSVKAWLKENRAEVDLAAEAEAVSKYGLLLERQTQLRSKIKAATTALHAAMAERYSALTESETKTLVVDHKWLGHMEAAIHGEVDRVSQHLTGRVKQLAERFETPLPQMRERVDNLEREVKHHLKAMGFTWQ
jgi:type I restriction enzyme M protein